jgi:hypothetical protein
MGTLIQTTAVALAMLSYLPLQRPKRFLQVT